MADFLPNLRFTKHAIQRCNEFGIPIKKAKWQVYRSEKEKSANLPTKYKKYPVMPNIAYYREGTVLFCVARVNDNLNSELMDLVLTVYDQRIELKTGGL